MKRHLRDLRLFVNTGMQFPACLARAALLDVDKGASYVLTTKRELVTCGKCKRIAARKGRS